MIYKKSQEERQKALLQMQWRVKSDRPQENQELDSEKVTRQEYDVKTNNAGKITKRRKTRTVMFGIQGIPGVVHTQSSNIRDMFTEGSLNPYVVDDPYAFD